MYEIEHMIIPSKDNCDKWINHIRENLAKKKHILLVARVEAGVVGFVSATYSSDFPLKVSQPFGRLNNLYVLPEYRRKGIGTRLVNECLKKMKDSSVKTIRLNVVKDNQPAINLYEKLGFKIHNYGMSKEASDGG